MNALLNVWRILKKQWSAWILYCYDGLNVWIFIHYACVSCYTFRLMINDESKRYEHEVKLENLLTIDLVKLLFDYN